VGLWAEGFAASSSVEGVRLPRALREVARESDWDCLHHERANDNVQKVASRVRADSGVPDFVLHDFPPRPRPPWPLPAYRAGGVVGLTVICASDRSAMLRLHLSDHVSHNRVGQAKATAEVLELPMISAKRLRAVRAIWTSVRRQSFWDRGRRHLREALARPVGDVMRLADDAASVDLRWSVV
jgi:hypothetical protein